MPKYSSIEDSGKGAYCACSQSKAPSNPAFCASGKKHYAPDLRLVPTHVEVHLDVDISKSRVVGRTVTRLLANDDGVRSISLDGVNFIDVNVSDGQKQGLEWTYDGAAVHLTWFDALKAGEERVVTVEYTFVEPITGMEFSTPDEHYPKRPTFAATDNESERARYWMVCLDHPTVRPTWEFHLTSLASHTLLANGVKSWEKTDEGSNPATKTACWRLDYPCPSYLTCVCIGDFLVVEPEPVDGIPIAYIAPTGTDRDDLIRTYDQTPKMIRWLTAKVARPFPFPKYYQIMLPDFGGAMENISLVTFSSVFFVDKAIAPEWKIDMADSVIIHEMGHSFFGDALVINHWEHAWLKESWATYIEALWLEDSRSKDEFEYDMFNNAVRYAGECSQYVRPIVTREYEHSWSMFDRHLYPGGAWRLHMLRKLIGDDHFWKGVQNYVKMFDRRTVETEDLKRALEAQSHRNLTRFFDQWIFSRGYPKLKGTYAYSAELRQVTVVFEQTQVDAQRSIGLFDFNLDVEIIEQQGDAVHVQTAVLDSITGKATVVFSGLKSKPVSVRVDPEMKVLFTLEMNAGEDILGSTLARRDNHTDIRNRIWAASELIKIASYSALHKVRGAMANEPFHGVRATVAKHFASKRTMQAAEIIAEMLHNEKEPRAFVEIINQHGAFRDSKLRHSLLAFLKREDLPSRTQWAAFQALANHLVAEDVSLIEKQISSENRWISGGAIRALGRMGRLQDEEVRKHVFEVLSKLVVYGCPGMLELCRPAAISAFGSFASELSQEYKTRAIDILSDVLHTANGRTIKETTVGALVALQARGTLNAVKAVRPSIAVQYHPSFDKQVAALSRDAAATSNESVLALKREVDDLSAQVRRLEDTIRALTPPPAASAASAAASADHPQHTTTTTAPTATATAATPATAGEKGV
eukprot:TRINITY_DN3907_c0_g1_i1.p1 TRINITY_DN3907_c0_g1~~TRINITY_DN3907_c0_g1_i1.p1  ORF type:complete len:923 (+),score=149.14 TRINITY_DN3907_c0_g1_i1:15-2783(+)